MSAAVFRRREIPPRSVKKYSDYRPFVREDFAECCAYCLLPEILAAGSDNFELDHFRPRSLPRFARLVNDFYNLYYSCHVCNGYKRDAWPSPSLEAAGYGFLDLCAVRLSDHLREEPDGSWSPLSRLGEYTLERLRLNRRHLVRIRLRLREIGEATGRGPLDWNVPLRDQVHALLTNPNMPEQV